MTLVLLALAGGFGAATRFVVDSLIDRHDRFRVPAASIHR